EDLRQPMGNVLDLRVARRHCGAVGLEAQVRLADVAEPAAVVRKRHTFIELAADLDAPALAPVPARRVVELAREHLVPHSRHLLVDPLHDDPGPGFHEAQGRRLVLLADPAAVEPRELRLDLFLRGPGPAQEPSDVLPYD